MTLDFGGYDSGFLRNVEPRDSVPPGSSFTFLVIAVDQIAQPVLTIRSRVDGTSSTRAWKSELPR